MSEADIQVPAGRDSASKPRRVRPLRTLLILAGALVLIALVAAGAVIGPLVFEKNHYAGVASIEQDSRFRDPRLMQAAWSLPVARAYARGGFEYQANPSFCGPTSVADLMKSIGRPTDQRQAIAGTRYNPMFGILVGGLTIDQLADILGQRLAAPVQIVRDPTLEQFRSWMRRANDPGLRIIVNFHRGPMFGRGHGHFSPILGYLEKEDLVLVGDVNRSYRPYLVSSERLWRAAETVDSATGKDRGLIVARTGAAGR
jgi:hypothetical protein